MGHIGFKTVRIYDYIDIHEPVCDSMYHKRLKGYAAIGYQTIQLGQPSLFDNVEFMPESLEYNQIFNGRSCLRPLSKSIVNAKRSIVISSPRLYRVASNKLVPLLKEQSANGVEVAIVAAKNDEQSDFLKSLGFHVIVKTGVKIGATIIDKSIVWYGSVCVLGYSSEDDNIIKIEDNKLAVEMLDVINY